MRKPVYIQMFSIHGLLRSENMELGRDADTGGQIKYVVELARALSREQQIKRVDLFTRLVSDKTVSSDYAKAIEEIDDKFRIVRIQCGGRKYIRKELLWSHLDEYIDKTIKFIKTEDSIPDIVHGHYADGGYVAGQLAEFFGAPFIFTGHSLGRTKKQKLMSDGLAQSDIDRKYKINHRIQVEEDILKATDLVITSTNQEIKEQYRAYESNDLPRFKVIPPGLDVDKFYPYYHEKSAEPEEHELRLYAHASLSEELNRFFMNTEKPLILTLCRPDKKKNIGGLIQAYGEDKELQSMANLAIFAGIRKDISLKDDNEKDVLTRMLLLMDKYDLYGKMAIPKKHDFQHEVPELYRITGEKKGVFVNVALTEPFGLTLIESAATGVPVVATRDGGPKDIIRNCKCGILVNPQDPKAIATAIKKIITDGELWKTYSKNGVINIRKKYTWESHVSQYIRHLNPLLKQTTATDMSTAMPSDTIGRRIIRLHKFIISDIDNTLIGKDNGKLKAFIQFLKKHRNTIGFGVATGRTLESAVSILKKHHIDPPDLIISSVGSELHYGESLHFSRGWETHISKKWDRNRIKEILDPLHFLEYQEEDVQRKYKVSYYMAPSKDRLAAVHELLSRNKVNYNLIYSHDQYLDILPKRASKGKAIRYLSYKWEIPIGNFLVCGDSGNDEEMLRGDPLGIIVGNFSHELNALKNTRNIFFAKAPCAGGIMEGLAHYKFADNSAIPSSS